MNHYEICFLLHPDQSTTMPEVLGHYRELVEGSGGKIHREEDWGRRPLCYMIRKAFKAHYALLNVECSVEILEEIKTAFRYNDSVLRNLILRRDDADTTASPMGHEANQAKVSLGSKREFKEITQVDYKNIAYLGNFMMETGRIVPARLSQLPNKMQRRIARAIKQARFLSLLPYCDTHKGQA